MKIMKRVKAMKKSSEALDEEKSSSS